MEHCSYSLRLLNRLKSLDTKNSLDYAQIEKAIHWARKYHGSQTRKSGEPYYTHPLEVAYMVSEYLLKTDVIIAAILHDIIEDTEVTSGMILDNYGWRVTEMVNRLTRNQKNGAKLSIEEVIHDSYEGGDHEALLIKLLDRLHNMLTIGSLSDKKIKEITQETIENFIVLSVYLDFKVVEKNIIELCKNIMNNAK